MTKACPQNCSQSLFLSPQHCHDTICLLPQPSQFLLHHQLDALVAPQRCAHTQEPPSLRHPGTDKPRRQLNRPCKYLTFGWLEIKIALKFDLVFEAANQRKENVRRTSCISVIHQEARHSSMSCQFGVEFPHKLLSSHGEVWRTFWISLGRSTSRLPHLIPPSSKAVSGVSMTAACVARWEREDVFTACGVPLFSWDLLS